MTQDSDTEAPCSETGKPCVWLCEEWEDNGVYCWDHYCADCSRGRDWSRDELTECKSTTSTATATTS